MWNAENSAIRRIGPPSLLLNGMPLTSFTAFPSPSPYHRGHWQSNFGTRPNEGYRIDEMATCCRHNAETVHPVLQLPWAPFYPPPEPVFFTDIDFHQPYLRNPPILHAGERNLQPLFLGSQPIHREDERNFQQLFLRNQLRPDEQNLQRPLLCEPLHNGGEQNFQQPHLESQLKPDEDERNLQRPSLWEPLQNGGEQNFQQPHLESQLKPDEDERNLQRPLLCEPLQNVQQPHLESQLKPDEDERNLQQPSLCEPLKNEGEQSFQQPHLETSGNKSVSESFNSGQPYVDRSIEPAALFGTSITNIATFVEQLIHAKNILLVLSSYPTVTDENIIFHIMNQMTNPMWNERCTALLASVVGRYPKFSSVIWNHIGGVEKLLENLNETDRYIGLQEASVVYNTLAILNNLAIDTEHKEDFLDAVTSHLLPYLTVYDDETSEFKKIRIRCLRLINNLIDSTSSLTERKMVTDYLSKENFRPVLVKIKETGQLEATLASVILFKMVHSSNEPSCLNEAFKKKLRENQPESLLANNLVPVILFSITNLFYAPHPLVPLPNIKHLIVSYPCDRRNQNNESLSLLHGCKFDPDGLETYPEDTNEDPQDQKDTCSQAEGVFNEQRTTQPLHNPTLPSVNEDRLSLDAITDTLFDQMVKYLEKDQMKTIRSSVTNGKTLLNASGKDAQKIKVKSLQELVNDIINPDEIEKAVEKLANKRLNTPGIGPLLYNNERAIKTLFDHIISKTYKMEHGILKPKEVKFLNDILQLLNCIFFEKDHKFKIINSGYLINLIPYLEPQKQESADMLLIRVNILELFVTFMDNLYEEDVKQAVYLHMIHLKMIECLSRLADHDHSVAETALLLMQPLLETKEGLFCARKFMRELKHMFINLMANSYKPLATQAIEMFLSFAQRFVRRYPHNFRNMDYFIALVPDTATAQEVIKQFGSTRP